MQPSTTANPIVVKFVCKGPPLSEYGVWLRQFPKKSGIWGACRFIFDPDATAYDWLVVYDDLPCLDNERISSREELLRCARENTILVTTEPITVKRYSRQFLAQFGHVLTSQEQEYIQHPNAIFTQTGLHWFYGKGRNHYITYDELSAARPPAKDRQISTVCSSKRQKHTLHNLRYEFTVGIKKALPEIDHYGHGVRQIDDKAEALDRYRYHIAIENHICLHHWTEKLADSFLGFCLPFYCGCPNAADYFPPESFIEIDLLDLQKSIDSIKLALAGDEYEKRLPAILEARRLVLNEYNLFAVLARTIESRHVAQPAAPNQMIYSRRAIRNSYKMLRLLGLPSNFLQRQRVIEK
jgi:hypothetical protein